MTNNIHSLDSLKQVAKAGGLDLSSELPEQWITHWEASKSADVPFLDAEALEKVCSWLGMNSDVACALEETRAAIQANAALKQIAQLGRYCLFLNPNEKVSTKGWLSPKSDLGPNVGLFWAVVLLSGVEVVRASHRELGIDDAVTVDTLSDLELWIKHQKTVSGIWEFKNLNWLSNHFSRGLFKLGRLQYIRSSFPYDLHAFKHRTENRIVVLAGEGMVFRADGQFANADRQLASEGVWTATYKENDSQIKGFLLDARGFVRQEQVELKAAEWVSILKKGDLVLDTHMPASGPMGHDICGASHAMALEFYPKHFPNWDFKAFVCFSWLLDPQLQEYLKPSSNVVQYQKEFFLHPKSGANGAQHFDRVFGGPVKDLDAAPQDSSMQRALIQHCKAGKNWRVGCSILFREWFEWGNPTKIQFK